MGLNQACVLAFAATGSFVVSKNAMTETKGQAMDASSAALSTQILFVRVNRAHVHSVVGYPAHPSAMPMEMA